MEGGIRKIFTFVKPKIAYEIFGKKNTEALSNFEKITTEQIQVL